MSDFNVNEASLEDIRGGGGNTDESKFSKMLQKHFNNIGGLNYGLIAYDYLRRNTEFQLRMMDLMLAFLTQWSSRYESGYWSEGEKAYALGKMAHNMLAAANRGGTYHRS